MKPYIYLRGLRHVDHSVFSVDNGQKKYYDPQFGRSLAYSSGQQVKRSIMNSLAEELNVPFAAITFNWEVDKKSEKASMLEPHSPCDPSFPDQLLGGYMKAESNAMTVKRRSPLSISAMRPLHPLLGGSLSSEPVSFDRSSQPEAHTVKVYHVDGKNRTEIPEDQLEKWLSDNNRALGPKYYNPGGQARTTGLFVYDIAIDLRTLFSVLTNRLEPELFPGKAEELRASGWIDSSNTFGKCLVLPEDQREKYIPALAHALINWRITSNQSRTFSPMETLAVAISDNANQITYAIRGDIADTDEERQTAIPRIDEHVQANLYVTPAAAGYIKGAVGSAKALTDAETELTKRMLHWTY